jgi:hypothetical protein
MLSCPRGYRHRRPLIELFAVGTHVEPRRRIADLLGELSDLGAMRQDFGVCRGVRGLPIDVDEMALVGWARGESESVLDQLLDTEMRRLPGTAH